MSSQLLAPREEHRLAISSAAAVACPSCSAALPFLRSTMPHIDECGFESYRLQCTECQAELAGIIDPFDDALLLSESVS
ncbi:MAG: hypothetical protein ACLPX7_02345 [Xanthobacteraceae bacterium]